jgi:hypothetical protein
MPMHPKDFKKQPFATVLFSGTVSAVVDVLAESSVAITLDTLASITFLVSGVFVFLSWGKEDP